MSLTFYYAPMSTATITQLVIEELGVACDKVKIDLKAGGAHTADYLRLNPNGKVPLLVHEGVPIWESAAITLYLGEVFGVDKGLYPPPGPQRGALMKWVVWSNVTLGDAVYRWLRNTAEHSPQDQRNAKAGEAGKADMHACLKILDQSLEGRQFLGEAYSLADTHVGAFTDWLRFCEVDFSAYPHLNAWAERCHARPTYAKVMSAG
ncbi:MAG: glutathione S-transferase family protein [Aquabacterium sp.]